MFMGGFAPPPPPPNIETKALVKDAAYVQKNFFAFSLYENKLTRKTLLSDFHRKFNLTLQCYDEKTHVALDQTLKITLPHIFIRSTKNNGSVSEIHFK